MTTPGPYSDVSSPVTAPAQVQVNPARQFTEPLRELCVLALLVGNGVFLFLGFSGLFFVIDRWASDFGARCAAVFGTFVGPLSLGLPILAMLLATHVTPMLRRARIYLIIVLSELGVSALFGAITFLGAFANDLSSVRATLEGTLWRCVWTGFLVLVCIVVVRLWLGLFPQPKPGMANYGGYLQPSYGHPYPGQPMYPHQQQPTPPPTFAPGTAAPPYPTQTLPPQALTEPTAGSGWPLVPPPPMPAPLVVEAVNATIRVPPATIELTGEQVAGLTGDLTQKVAAPTADDPGSQTQKLASRTSDTPESTTQQIGH